MYSAEYFLEYLVLCVNNKNVHILTLVTLVLYTPQLIKY